LVLAGLFFPNQTYSYDGVGNLTAKNGVAHQYLDPAHIHAVTHLNGSLNYTYDANGNMLTRSEAGVTYNQTWDAENRLASVTTGGQTTTFTYDGDGRRVKKQDASGTTIYIGQYYEVTGSSIRKYYSLGGQRIAMRLDGALIDLFNDHLGSTAVAYDTATTAQRQLYLPYGAPRWPNPSTLPTDYRFTGQRSEEAILGSLYDYGARFYSPAIGRFLSPDPIVPSPGDPQSLNRYNYVLGNPLRYVDPAGHVQQCADGDVCGSITYGIAPPLLPKPDWAYLIGDDPSHIDLSQAGLDYTKAWETPPPGSAIDITRPYNDLSSGHHCTIGYGVLIHLGACSGAESEQAYANGLTLEQADQLYKTKLKGYVNSVKSGVKRGLTQAQFDALADYAYNTGLGSLADALDVLNSHDTTAIASTIALMNTRVYAEGIEQPGLIRRRNEETAPFEPSQFYRFSYVRVPRVWYERAYGD
jgi:RHS repeat-associated protein